MIKRKTNYVNNKDLYADLTKFYEAKQRGEDPQISNFLGKCILLMAENMALRPNFRNYSYIEEMKADGIERAVSSIKSFNPHKSNNPFGWLSRTIWNAFIKRIGDEKKQHALKHKNQLRLHLFDSSHEVNDVSDGVVANYDRILQDRKNPKTKK
jgi:hypothetical protein